MGWLGALVEGRQPATAMSASRKRKARLRALAAALSLFAFLSAEAFGVDAVFMEGRGMSALAAAARDPMSLLDKRSPGARGAGALLQTKPGKRPPLLADRERRTPPPPADTPTGEGLPPPAPVFALRETLAPPPGQPAVDIPLTLAPPTPGTEGPPPGAPNVGGPGGGIVPLDFPGGGGGGPGTPLVVVPDTPGIPEPSVWATLIVGFFAVGAVMRARRRGPAATGQIHSDAGA